MATFFKSDSIPEAVESLITVPRAVDTLVVVGGAGVTATLYRSRSATAASYSASWDVPTGNTFSLGDDVSLTWGDDDDFGATYNSAGNEFRVLGLDVTDGGAGADTAGLQIDTGDYTVDDAVAGAPASGPILITSGATDVDAAAGGGIAGNSGNVDIFTGDTDTQDAAGTAGDTGRIRVLTGTASSTAGTGSGSSGDAWFGTGGSADANSGDVIVATGRIYTAGTTKGEILLDVKSNNLAGAPIKTNGIDFHDRLVLNEEFAQPAKLNASIAAGNNASFEISGLNAADANSIPYTGGGNQITTAGGVADQIVIVPHAAVAAVEVSAWNVTQWQPQYQIGYKAVFRTGADITTQKIMVGLKLTPTTFDNTTDNDQLYIGYASDGSLGGVAANFVAVATGNTADTYTDTGVVVAASTSYVVYIYVDANAIGHIYLNGRLIASTSQAMTAAAALVPFGGIEAIGGVVRLMKMQRLSCSRLYSA